MKRFLKKVVKKTFNVCGFEIRRTDTVGRTLAEVLDDISRLGFSPQTVIDVGVASGTFELYDAFPNARHLLIEPLEEFRPALEEITRQFNAEYVIAAASDKSGRIVINVHPTLEGSSILKEVEGSHVDGVERVVPAVTIDDLCNERNLREPYLVKVDVQGAELKVLNGGKKTLKETDLVILEVHFFQFFVNGPQFHDVVGYMKDRGFVVYDCFGGYYRPLDGALAAMDIAFVKENGQFRMQHFFATQEQRKRMRG